MTPDKRSIFIEADAETVCYAITKDKNFSVWYAPGSDWVIPILESGEKAVFTLMPSEHNQLEEGDSIPMSFTITEVVPNERFSYSSDADQFVFTFILSPENNGTRVTLNTEGFAMSLENLKAFAEGKELPNV